MNTSYTPDSVLRALDAHRAAGLIRYWRRDLARPFAVTVGLVDGETDFRLATLRETYVFVCALASAKHAATRAAQTEGTHRS